MTSQDHPLSSSEPTAEPLSFIVDEASAGARLDKFLTDQLSGENMLSRVRIRALIEQGQVAHETRGTISEPSYRVKPADRFTLHLPPIADAAPKPQSLPLTIVYEDDDLIVIDKPAGLVVHPAPGNPDKTLVNALLAHCGDSLSGIGGERRPGIVHRLDKETSGLMVAAKTDRAHQGLSEQFAAHGRDGRLSRAYLALVWGTLTPLKGTIDADLGRDRHNRRKKAVVPPSRHDARAAITHYRTLEQIGPPEARVSLIECRLETGRTHQIRVHLTHKGHPLLGDPLYGTDQKTRKNRLSPQAQNALKKLGRQALHAHKLGFEHPLTGEPLSFESPVPDDMEALILTLKTR